jgi:FkbM family methyltransferase
MSIFDTLGFIVTHPLNGQRKVAAIADFIRWQIGSRLVPGPVIYTWVNGSRMIVRPGEAGLTGNLYCGLHEFPDMAYLLHVVGPDDLFVDVGANVGSYTLLACAARGARGHAFEPVPTTFARLVDNLRINHLGDRVTAWNVGVADQAGELAFTSGENATNHVVTANDSPSAAVRVKVLPLDEVLGTDSPSVIKIDVEGFEAPVLSGASRTLANPALHSVIMELNGSGSRYGFKDEQMVRTMAGHGFSTFSYEPFSRQLTSLDGKNSRAGNTLFIRGEAAIRARLREAPKLLLGARWV